VGSWNKREEALLRAHAHEWQADFAPWTTQCRFHRGFVCCVAVDWQKLLDRADDLSRRAPIQVLRITGEEGTIPPDRLLAWAQEVAARPELRQLTCLDLTGLAYGEPVLRVLLSSPFVKGLTRLLFSDEDCQLSTAQVLARCSHLDRIKELDFLGFEAGELGDEGVAVLSACVHLHNLEHLDLRDNSLGPGAMRALAQSPHLKHIRSLYLGDGHGTPNEVGPEGARWLATSPNYSHLAVLHLDFNDIGNAGLGYLARSPSLLHLRSLSLVSNGLDGEGIQSLADDGVRWQMDKLDLSCNEIGDRGVEVLARSRRFQRMRRLSLAGNGIGPAGVRSLATAPWLSQTEELRLSSNPLGQEGVNLLLQAAFQSLSRLRLDSYGFNPAQKQALQARFGDRLDLEMLVLPSMDAGLH
jgi:Ran GTPase-activating protein (RanGAP) involved in mRNA processing and transport